jgi:predicted ATPase
VETNPEAKQRLEEYFRAILPAAAECKVATAPPYIGNYGTVVKPIGQDDLAEPQSLRFVFRFDGTVVAFGPHSLSDGTLRAFGILLALFQVRACSPRDPIPVVGIEEPEAALHPAAAGAMWDAMSEASHFTQVLVTTHSPDLLEVSDFDSESLVIVDMVDGETVLGEADEASKSILRDRLTTAGEMLRQNQLRAAPRPASPVDAST